VVSDILCLRERFAVRNGAPGSHGTLSPPGTDTGNRGLKCLKKKQT
jgi:hypothetical protein